MPQLDGKKNDYDYCAKKEKNKLGKMPKMKTKAGAKKRFKVTGSGKIKENMRLNRIF